MELRDRQRLEHIIEYCDDIKEYLSTISLKWSPCQDHTPGFLREPIYANSDVMGSATSPLC